MPAPPLSSLERLGDTFALDPSAQKKRMLVIVNPYATTVSDRLKTLVVYALQGRYDVQAVDTEKRDHATELCREAAQRGLRRGRRLRRRRHGQRGGQRPAGVQHAAGVGDKVYIVPAFGGTTGLLYDPEKVPGGVTSFRDLIEDPALEGKVAIEDNPKYGIAMAALALGFKDPYDLTDADLAQVKDWYIEHKSQIRAFYSDESDFFDLYQSGDVVAAFGYKGYDVGLAKQGASVTFTPASEGALTWTCGYALGASAQEVDGAYALLDWFLTPEAQAVYATKLNQMATNSATLDSLPQSVIEEIGLSDPTELDTSIPTQVPPNYDRWQEVWQEITSA